MSIAMTYFELCFAYHLSDVLVGSPLLGTSSIQTDPDIILYPSCVRQHD